MISNVNFTGKIYQTSAAIKNNSPKEEINKIQEYSNEKEVDVILDDRKALDSGAGYYEAILIKQNSKKSQPIFANKTFDFAHNPELKDDKEPEYKDSLSALTV